MIIANLEGEGGFVVWKVKKCLTVIADRRDIRCLVLSLGQEFRYRGGI